MVLAETPPPSGTQPGIRLVYDEPPLASWLAPDGPNLHPAMRTAGAGVGLERSWDEVPTTPPIPSLDGLRLERTEEGSVALVWIAGHAIYYALTSRPVDFTLALLTVV